MISQKGAGPDGMIGQKEEEYLTEKLLFNEQNQNKSSKLYPVSDKKKVKELTYLSYLQTPHGHHTVQVQLPKKHTYLSLPLLQY